MARHMTRAARYVAAGRAVLDHEGNELVPAKVARVARRNRIAGLMALRGGDQTGVGVKRSRRRS